MTRDHLLGSPALASLLAEEQPRPTHVTPQRVRPSAEQQAQRRALDAQPLATFAAGHLVRCRRPFSSGDGRAGTVVAVSESGATMRVHFEGDPQPDPGLYVTFAFERVVVRQ